MQDVSPTSKKVFVETWGCQMNVADSERMLSLLQGRGYAMTDVAADADLLLLNTCHIREKAKQKVVSRLGVLKQLKAKNPAMRIAVTGCVAQAEGAKLLKQAPQIDLLLGPGKIDELPRLLDEREATRAAAMAIGFDRHKQEKHESHDRAQTSALTGKNEVSRFVNIIQGCDNFCTFCVVPFTRGREISTMPAEIVRECQELISAGAKEITLLGQNVNSYGLDLVRDGKLAVTQDGAFVELLRSVLALPGLERVRFTTSNPHDFTQPLAQLYADHAKMGRYMHLPVQSGSDRMLEMMRRKVTRAEYLERIAWLRTAVPDMAISTDLIVGFPGESDEDFEATLSLVDEVRYSFVYSFKYSPRKGTAAARFKQAVPEDVMDKRLAKLNALQDQISIAQQEAEIGKTREVLVLYESRKDAGVLYGRTEHFRLVRIDLRASGGRDAAGFIGRLVNVKITDGNKTALVGCFA